jgi:adenylosuccinate synthase
MFCRTGVHALVDGQFGSTGKGALAGWLALQALEQGFLDNFEGSICSNGPNSGHTSYFDGRKIVLKQLPTFGVHAHLMGCSLPIYLSAGAVIDPPILAAEAEEYGVRVFVHPNAAIVLETDKEAEGWGPIMNVASTRSGTGAALARKIYRNTDVIARDALGKMPPNVSIVNHRLKPEDGAYFMEVAQGFSLGINSEFYPYVTSRECTVMQGIADARIPPTQVVRTYMSVRTYPIRVGNLGDISSGGWYDDQEEMSWEDLGVEPELTTVTKRIRRVASFSEEQLIDAVRANDPDFIFINFLNYMNATNQKHMINDVYHITRYLNKDIGLIGGYGPTNEDIRRITK